jgi:glyoxylase-like metal-dependent hydrolase (beta-lactamase superfamily II)
MTYISEVAEGIYQIDTEESQDFGTVGLPQCSTIYFVTDGGTALIDTGPAVVVPAVLDAIRQVGYDPLQLAYVIPTHIHLDHAGGVGTLAEQFPQIQVIVHQRGARHLIDPSRLIESTRQAFGDKFEDEYGRIVPIAGQQVHAAQDGEAISLGRRELRIYEAPGHAPHQLCIYDAKTKGVFSGEALGTPDIANAMVLPVFGFDLDASMETIDMLSKLDLEMIYCSHGGVSHEPVKLIESVRANTKAYGDIILESMKKGEGMEQMAKKLDAYQQERAPGGYQKGDRPWHNLIPWYVAHFKKKGMA